MNEKLKTIRNERNMYQHEVAKLIGINERTYSLKERSIHDFTITEARRLARVFNCTLNDLF